MRTPVAVHLLPLGEGKHSFYAPALVIGFPSPQERGWAGEPQRGDLTKPRFLSPKGRSNEAQANGPGQRDPNRFPSPEGAERPFSIPFVPLVVGNSMMRLQQLPEFLWPRGGEFLVVLRRVGREIAEWVNTYLALSGLGAKLGGHLNPGRWPGLRYFAPLGLNQRPSGAESNPSRADLTALWAEDIGRFLRNQQALGRIVAKLRMRFGAAV